jgi:enoyl-CoA hydratase/carnithine racemase
LPKLIGVQKAQLMCLTGRRIKAEEALGWGLVDEVVPLEVLRQSALALARELAENAPLAVEATRATLRGDMAAIVKAQTDKEFAIQSQLRKTADFAEGIRAVAERRAGNFTGT